VALAPVVEADAQIAALDQVDLDLVGQPLLELLGIGDGAPGVVAIEVEHGLAGHGVGHGYLLDMQP
jgi:hypothetical protein